MASELSPVMWSSTWTGISLLFLVIICFQYDSVISVYVKDCTTDNADGPSNGVECVYLPLEGVGFFSAGYLANGGTVPGARLGDNRVLWSELTPTIACVPGTDVYEKYSKPLKLCRWSEKDGESGYRLVIPTTIRQLQLEIQIAMVSAFLSWVSALFYLCSQSYRLAVTSIGMSATAMFACFHCVKLWMHWEGTKMYTTGEGFYLPLWADDKSGATAVPPLQYRDRTGVTHSGASERGLIVERFLLNLNNPQFQLLIATIPSFLVGMVGTTYVVAMRFRAQYMRDAFEFERERRYSPLNEQRRQPAQGLSSVV